MSETRDPSRDQNLPKGGHQEVQQALIDVIADRRNLGIRKYGQPVMTHNGRSALRDAWEEVIDLAVYLTQMMLEAGEEILPKKTEEAHQPMCSRSDRCGGDKCQPLPSRGFTYMGPGTGLGGEYL